MGRFLKDSDYDLVIKSEIKTLLTGAGATPAKLLQAENTAIAQIKKWISGRYDIDQVFIDAPSEGEEDDRDAFIVVTVIDIALYHLYSQTGNRDVPEHRKNRYQDALDWIQSAGKGEVDSDLPTKAAESYDNDIRLSSRPPENHKW